MSTASTSKRNCKAMKLYTCSIKHFDPSIMRNYSYIQLVVLATTPEVCTKKLKSYMKRKKLCEAEIIGMSVEKVKDAKIVSAEFY